MPDASQASSSSQWSIDALTRVRDARVDVRVLEYENRTIDFKRHSRRRRRIEPNNKSPRCDVTHGSRPRFKRTHFQIGIIIIINKYLKTED